MNVSEEIFNRRLERMTQLIAFKAPRIMLHNEAQLICRALEHPLKYKVRQFFYGLHDFWLRLRYRNV